MSQATDDMLASLAHGLRQMDREANDLRADNARLCAIVGTETPIGAFDLVTTWRAEKQGYMEEVQRLRAALEDLLTGAEQQSQSHTDVAAKCRAALGVSNGE